MAILVSMNHFTNRKDYIGKLFSYKDKDFIKVISGLRRSGKSTLVEIYRKQLINQGIGKLSNFGYKACSRQ